MLLPMKSNVFDIPERLKAIDNFEVFFNTDKQQYDIYKYDCFGSYLFTSVDELDGSTVEKVQKIFYLNQNPFKMVEEMDSHNERLVKKAKEKAFLEASDKVKDITKYVNKFESKETVDVGAFKTKWI